MGRPCNVFLPLIAQLLLPLFFSGLSSASVTVVILLKYSESAVAGIFGITVAGGNDVPFGMIGSRLSGTCGNNLSNSALGKKLRAFVIPKSSSCPASSYAIYLMNRAVFRFVHR